MARPELSDEELAVIDKEYCTYGDKIHADKNPKVFRDCNGSFMYDSKNTPFLDLEMWFASCNLGYKNKRIRDAVVDQIDTLPQISSHFQYDYKVLLSEKIAKANIKRFGRKGLYIAMIRFIAPLFLIALLLMSTGILS